MTSHHAVSSLILIGVLVGPAVGAGAAERQATASAERLQQNFLTEHEIGKQFRVMPTDLPPPKTGPIVTNRSLTLPFAGQSPQVPPGFTATLFASGLANPRRLLVLPNGDVLVAEQSAGYLTLLRDDGDGRCRMDRAPCRGPQQALRPRLARRLRPSRRPGRHLERAAHTREIGRASCRER